MEVSLRDGTRLEGLFDGYTAATGKITLKMVYESMSDDAKPATEHVCKEFDLAQMHSFLADNVNFVEVTGGGATGFATDSDISGVSRDRSGTHRELAKWEDGGVATDIKTNNNHHHHHHHHRSLEEEDGPPGQWNQFETNERLFGVVTSFDESAYTTEIDRTSAEYQRLTVEAERLAREIEKGVIFGGGVVGGNNLHLAEERGIVFDDSQIDEEDRYGAVLKRPVEKKDPVVIMPASISSSSSPRPSQSTSPTAQGQTQTQTTTTSGPGNKPRRSIVANLQSANPTDPEMLSQAMEMVQSSSEAMQRRLSQAGLEDDPQKKRKEMFERHKKEKAEDFKSFSDKLSTRLGGSSNEPSLSSTTSSASASSLSLPANKLNPNAADFVPTGNSTNLLLLNLLLIGPPPMSAPFYNPYSLYPTYQPMVNPYAMSSPYGGYAPMPGYYNQQPSMSGGVFYPPLPSAQQPQQPPQSQSQSQSHPHPQQQQQHHYSPHNENRTNGHPST